MKYPTELWCVLICINALICGLVGSGGGSEGGFIAGVLVGGVAVALIWMLWTVMVQSAIALWRRTA